MMSELQKMSRIAAAIILGGFILTGCATNREERAFETEKLLVSAGFTYKVADTPKRMEQLKKLPQRKLVQHKRDSRIFYLFADADGCKCVWAGNQAAHDRLRELVRSEKLTAQQQGGIWLERYDVELTAAGEYVFVDAVEDGMLPID